VFRSKQTVERYLDGFTWLDRAQILSCLTDDIEGTVFGLPGGGEEAYDEHITQPGMQSTDAADRPAGRGGRRGYG
jgi:uncharacterized protein